MPLTGKFVDIAQVFIWLRLISFYLGVDKEGWQLDREPWWFEHSFVIIARFLSRRGC